LHAAICPYQKTIDDGRKQIPDYPKAFLRAHICQLDGSGALVVIGGAQDCGEYCQAAGAIAQGQGSVEIIYYNQRPLVRLRSLFCLVQRSFPLLSGVVLCFGLSKDSVGNLELTMRCAVVGCCIPGTWRLFRWGFADRTNGGHGLRLAALHINADPLTKK
jgi:hypothetical protein